MNAPAGFSEWYEQKLGHQPLYVQILLWLFYGFLWIPIWYNVTPRFSSWYGQKLGHQPWYVHALLWLFYGFIWIPIWYAGSRSSVAEAATTAAAPAIVPATAPRDPLKHGTGVLAAGVALLLLSPLIVGFADGIPTGFVSGLLNGVALSGFILPPIGLVFIAMGVVARRRRPK